MHEGLVGPAHLDLQIKGWEMRPGAAQALKSSKLFFLFFYGQWLKKKISWRRITYSFQIPTIRGHKKIKLSKKIYF
jgi:hypothetical protein